MNTRRRIALFTLAIALALCARTHAQITAEPKEIQWTQTKAEFAAKDLRAGPSAKLVGDKLAASGQAVAALTGQGRAGHVVSGGWVPIRTDAAYEIAFRIRLDVRVTSPPDVELPIYLGTEDKAASTRFGWPLRLEAVYRKSDVDKGEPTVLSWAFVKITDPKKVASYNDYVIRFERPPTGLLGFRVYWYGRAFCSAWIESVKIREMPLPSEAKQIESAPPPPKLAIDHAKPRTLVVMDVYHWTYRLPEIVGGACDATYSFPRSAVELAKYDAVVLANVNLGRLDIGQRLLLREFVKDGGAVLILGGPYSYGKSRVHTSPLLQELLPVRTSGLWDIRKADLILAPAGARLKKLEWNAEPMVYYHHMATPKPDAHVWLNGQPAVNSEYIPPVPLLVVRRDGKGIVAAFLVTPFGDPAKGQTAFWEWQDWGRLLNLALDALRGRSADRIEPPGYQPPEVVTSPRPPPPGPRSYPGPAKPTGEKIEVFKVWPSKICYRPGEKARGTITLWNGTAQPADVQLAVSLVSGLEDVKPLKTFRLKLSAKTQKEVAVNWRVDEREFGRELRAELKDTRGQTLDLKGEYFTVGWNNYRLGQSRLVQPWTWDQHAKTFPVITPEDRWKIWIPGVRNAFAVVTEYFFWAPDDFGNLTPGKDMWFSGQATYLISQADIHAVIDAAHSQGIAAVTYGKDWMSVSGTQAGRDGVELVRMHPEWCQWKGNGQPEWWFDVKKYLWTLDQWRDLIEQKGKQGIGGAAVDSYGLDTVHWGLDEIVRSAKKYGWDGVRWDDHLTVDTIFDGGLDFTGQTVERGEDYEALSARNNRLTRELTRKANPHFLVGYNYGGTYTDWGVRQPDAFAETCKDGQFVMIEHSSWWHTYRPWRLVASLLAQENHRVAALGGVPGMMPMGTADPQARRWEAAMNYASQGHYYNVNDNPQVVRYTRFMVRYGGLLYDARTRFIENADGIVSVSPADKVLYREYLHQRQLDDRHRQWIVGIVNAPPDGVIKDVRLPAPPVENVQAVVTVPDGWKVEKVWRLDPDAADPCVAVPVSPNGNKLTVAVAKLEVWNLIVVELARS
jgi:uncharacterized membrane protein